jgi:hypothetical protein
LGPHDQVMVVRLNGGDGDNGEDYDDGDEEERACMNV